MSLIMLIAPLAVAVLVTSAETVDAVLERRNNPQTIAVPIPTRFNSTDLLVKTLKEHGLETQAHNERIIVNCSEGQIVYDKTGVDGSYEMNLSRIRDIDKLYNDIACIEQEYDANVQSYTYEHIMQSMPDNMTVESEEVLEDDSILLTIAVN